MTNDHALSGSLGLGHVTRSFARFVAASFVYNHSKCKIHRDGRDKNLLKLVWIDKYIKTANTVKQIKQWTQVQKYR